MPFKIKCKFSFWPLNLSRWCIRRSCWVLVLNSPTRTPLLTEHTHIMDSSLTDGDIARNHCLHQINFGIFGTLKLEQLDRRHSLPVPKENRTLKAQTCSRWGELVFKPFSWTSTLCFERPDDHVWSVTLVTVCLLTVTPSNRVLLTASSNILATSSSLTVTFLRGLYFSLCFAACVAWLRALATTQTAS